MDDSDGCGCNTILLLGIAAWILSSVTGGSFWIILLVLFLVWLAV